MFVSNYLIPGGDFSHFSQEEEPGATFLPLTQNQSTGKASSGYQTMGVFLQEHFFYSNLNTMDFIFTGLTGALNCQICNPAKQILITPHCFPPNEDLP